MVMLPLRGTRPGSAPEVPARFLWQLATSAFLPQAISVRAWCLHVENWTEDASSCVVSACLKDWSAAAELYLVFAMGQNY